MSRNILKIKNGASLVVSTLERLGVRIVSGMPGGAILPIYDALYQSGIRHISARHEQAAGFIAGGFARATGQVGVCLATSGPGATNLLTPLADAFADSIPLVAITGQVPRHLRGTNAFQEVNICAMAKPHLRAAFSIESIDEIEATIHKAFAIAKGPRPGPVLVDIPKDIQVAELPNAVQADFALTNPEERRPAPDTIAKIAAMLAQAERPVVYIGGGIIHSEASFQLRAFVHEQQLPVVSTLMGLGAISGDDPLFCGMLGMHAARYTNLMLARSDLLLVIGARFDDRAIGLAKEFCPDATIIHIDIDPAEFGKIVRPAVCLTADAGPALAALRAHGPLPDRETIGRRKRWWSQIDSLKRDHPIIADSPTTDTVALMVELSNLCTEDIITTDVGQHQMWVAQFMRMRRPRQLLTSGGLGAMGFGLPAAIGAALACPDRRVVCISGDGSILLNIQELALLAELQLNVKILILNNEHLGLVRQQQELFFESRFSQSAITAAPDFVALTRAFGIQAQRIESRDLTAPRTSAEADTENTHTKSSCSEVSALRNFLEELGPGLLEIPIAPDEMVLPMVPPGSSNLNMLGAQDRPKHWTASTTSRPATRPGATV